MAEDLPAIGALDLRRLGTGLTELTSGWDDDPLPIATSAAYGAELGGCGPELTGVLTEFAEQLGVVFQLLTIGLFTILISRYVSLGSLVGMFSLPLFVLAGGSFLVPHLFLAICLTLLAIFRHRENIRRLLTGTERRLGEKATPKSADGA